MPKITWKQSDVEFLNENYGKIRTREIADRLGFTHKAIKSKARKLGLFLSKNSINRRIHQFNDRFFSIIDNRRAYWAGFIAADGCVMYKTCTLSIGLHLRDTAHLEKFAVDVEYTGKVRVYAERESANIGIHGARQMMEDLRQIYNIVPRKSLILEPPNLTEPSHIMSFLSGYIDGDGTIQILKNDESDSWKRKTVTVIGTEKTVTWARDQLAKIVDVDIIKYPVRVASSIFSLAVCGKNAERVVHHIYSLDIPHLDRKVPTEFIDHVNRKTTEHRQTLQELQEAYEHEKILRMETLSREIADIGSDETPSPYFVRHPITIDYGVLADDSPKSLVEDNPLCKEIREIAPDTPYRYITRNKLGDLLEKVEGN